MKTSLESVRNSIKTGTKKETVIRLFLWNPAAAYPPMPSYTDSTVLATAWEDRQLPDPKETVKRLFLFLFLF